MIKSTVLCVLGSFLCTVQILANDLKLWYTTPAKEWVEALPLGNSKLGVMVFGGVAQEVLQLNEETMWGGGPYKNPDFDNASPYPSKSCSRASNNGLMASCCGVVYSVSV